MLSYRTKLYLEIKGRQVAKAENEDGGPVEEDRIRERTVGIDVHHPIIEHLQQVELLVDTSSY